MMQCWIIHKWKSFRRLRFLCSFPTLGVSIQFNALLDRLMLVMLSMHHQVHNNPYQSQLSHFRLTCQHNDNVCIFPTRMLDPSYDPRVKSHNLRLAPLYAKFPIQSKDFDNILSHFLSRSNSKGPKKSCGFLLHWGS